MIGMDDPLFMARMQAGIDAVLLHGEGVPLPEAIRQTVGRMRYLFGEDIPREIVEVTVTLAYCSQPHSTDLEGAGDSAGSGETK